MRLPSLQLTGVVSEEAGHQVWEVLERPGRFQTDLLEAAKPHSRWANTHCAQLTKSDGGVDSVNTKGCAVSCYTLTSLTHKRCHMFNTH